jgi:hypothetical protein
MAKKATKTRVEIEDDPDDAPAGKPASIRDHNEQGDPDDPLAGITAATGGAAGFAVRVYRYNADGTREGIGRFDAGDFDPMRIAEQWGGGRFRFQVVNARGQIVRTLDYRHVRRATDAPHGTPYAPIYTGAPQPSAPSLVPNPPAMDPLSLVLARLEELSRRVDEKRRDEGRMELRDILPLIQRPEPFSIKDLLPLITARHTTPLGELLAAMGQLRELTGADADPAPVASSGGDDIVGALTGLLARFAPASPPPAPRPGVPRPAPGPAPLPTPTPRQTAAPPAPTDEQARPEFSMSALHEAASLLALGWKQMGNPQLYAGFVIDTLGEDLAQPLLAGELPPHIAETLNAYLPFLSNEQCATWLGQVLVNAREQIAEWKAEAASPSAT